MKRVAAQVACAALSIGLAMAARAQPSLVRVELGELGTLAPGDHAEVVVEVYVEPSARGPLLVTPSVDGAAIQVVRGRLFRFDAEDPDANPLRFRVPIAAMSVGTAVLLVRVDGHACEGGHCEPVEAEARRAIEVR
jgi:hypothetical protein